MKFSLIGRWSMALFASLALGLGMTACGGGTIGYMWVLGQEYNQVAGFKVDQYSGNLTEVPGSPFSSNGSVPISIVIKQGGRFVYVINQGVGGGANGAGKGQSIALYSVGGDGTLAFQLAYTTVGYVSEWAQMDSSGTYLYVLDKYSPALCTASSTACTGPVGTYTAPNTDGNGSITAFVADPNTGRLTLLTNSQSQVNQVNLPFWEVGPSPVMSKSQGGCLYTVNGGYTTSGAQTVTPYSIGAGGQLVFTTTGNIVIPQSTTGVKTNITSINGSGNFMFLTDAASNILYGYQSGGACGLTALNGGYTNLASLFPNTSDPTYTMIDSTGKYLYVANNSTTSTQPTTPFSSLSALTINSTNQQLQPIIGSPYPVGSAPVCIVEDPSNQYIYTSNYNDGTVTGFQLNNTTGELSQLTKGSKFTAVGKASCLAISGAVD
ncbi:MAG TPA: beta-propeller fold lactonase family protein [Acidobacteriaceae bacterium]|jgi:6-phosphogluconolactonase (cycloisomerase 2 family)|nr:beta-propeller fold lactonase family protein [Acidobacteriaceae bacterium]